MKRFLEYITALLGFCIVIKRIYDVAAKALPIYITENFAIYKTQMWGANVALLKPKEDDAFTPDQMQRIKEMVELRLNMKVIFIFDTIKAYNRQRLIAKNINFIALDKQVFIPSLMVDLQPERKREPVKAIKLTPLAQQIVLSHLQKQTINGLTSKDVSAIFQTTYITANRAVNSLEELNVITLSDEKERRIEFKFKGRELWDEVEPLLKSPVSKVLYTDNQIEGATVSNINALAHYTMINEERNYHYAIYKNDIGELSIKTDKQFGENKIEVWKYPPTQFANGEYVDRLSLYLSLREDKDERVQIELESLINEMKWL